VNPLDELSRLTSLFPESEPLLTRAEHIPGTVVPEPYKHLLVHDQHMTVTVEEYHGCAVDVHVLAAQHEGNSYTRKIILTRQGTEDPVLFGLVRFDFQFVTPEVRDEILSGQTPLGRILINHNVFRHIDLGAILEITAGPALARLLHMPSGATTYGRLATIFCNRRPAVDLLEIVAPLKRKL
jgi:chorismate-pyruvate lyase